MESIEIKNFGPIKHVKLNLKDINVFIGTTASGKSTVAKLVAIFRNMYFIRNSSLDTIKELLINYNINYELSFDTYIVYKEKSYYWKLSEKNLESNYPFESLMSMIHDMGIWLAKEGIEAVSNKDRLAIKARFILPLMYMIESKRDTILDKIDTREGRKEFTSFVETVTRRRNQLVHDISMSTSEIDELATKTYEELLSQTGTFNSTYIPAERSFLSVVTESFYGLISNDIAIAKILSQFGSTFEKARKRLRTVTINFLSSEYRFSDGVDLIKVAEQYEVRLENASSGFQALIPLFLVVYANTERVESFENNIIIEEPELNLYPTTQKELMDFIVERINQSKSRLIVTTHSPYILTALDNLIQADNVIRKNPDAKEEVEKLVPPRRWVNFDRVACYYFENGTCRSTLDNEQRSIGPSNIDDVSDAIGSIYDQLLAMKYDKVL